MTDEKNIYQSPSVMMIEIKVEKGFASSLDYKQNPSMPYGDENEEWF